MQKLSILGVILCLLLFLASRVQAQIRPDAPPAGIAEEQQAEKRASRAVTPVEKGGTLLPNWHLVIEPYIEYDHISGQNVAISGFQIFESILIGQLNVTKIKRDIFMPGVNIRLGAFNTELNLKVPYMIRSDQMMFGGQGQLSGRTVEKDISDNGIGDLELFGYYHLLKEGTWRHWVPDTVIRLGVHSPTGRDPYHLEREDIDGLGLTPIQFPTGTGHWGTSAGVTFIKSADPAVFFLNLAYFYNFARYVGTAGDPAIDFGTIKLGNTFEYSLGLIFAINERLSMNFALDQRLTGKTTQNGDRLADSQLNAISFNIGGTYMVSPRYTVDLVVAIGLSQDAPNVSAMLRLPISFQF